MSKKKWYFTAGRSPGIMSDELEVYINVCDKDQVTYDDHVSEKLGDRIPEDWEEVTEGTFVYGPWDEDEPMTLEKAVKIWEAAGLECLEIEDDV